MTIRTVVADDEPLARQNIRRLLARHKDVHIIEECGDGQSTLAAIHRHKPELLFLDVQMPELDGFAVLAETQVEDMPRVIFVTAYDQYALAAFDANAVDYLLKPIEKPRFDRALQRARERLHGTADRDALRHILGAIQSLGAQKAYADRIPVFEKGRILFLQTSDLHWLESSGNYVRLHAGSRSYEIRDTLTNLERKLDPKLFARIHRSTIVNRNQIREVQRWFHGYHLVVLRNGTELRMSRYQKDLTLRLGSE